MNAAHLHLLLNHFPLVGFVFSMVFLVLGSVQSNVTYMRAGFLIILVAGFLAVPTYLAGEPAEKVIEKLPGFSEKLVKAHEEAAELAIWFIGATILFAGAAFWLSVKNNDKYKLMLKITIALNLISLILIARTSNYGGKISHPEIRELVENGVNPSHNFSATAFRIYLAQLQRYELFQYI